MADRELTADDIKVFIQNLTSTLKISCFDSLTASPMAFSDLLGNVINYHEAVEKLHLPEEYGKPLQDLLKPAQPRKGVGGTKRKLQRSFNGELKVKFMKTDAHESCATDTEGTQDELPGTSAIEDKQITMGNTEEEESEYINFDDKRIKEAIVHLNSFLEKDNLDSLKKVLHQSRDEDELETGIGIHLFSMLKGKACTSKSRSKRVCPCGCQKQLESEEKMWIGSENTWYGELDIIAGNPADGDAVSVYMNKCDESSDGEIETDELLFEGTESEEEGDEEAEASDLAGDSPDIQTNVEVKYNGLAKGIKQAIAQAVVFAFTEYRRHDTEGDFIPSLLIDKANYQIVIYSPVYDILLVSDLMDYSRDVHFEKSSGSRPFILLWIILNHRLFFTKCPDLKHTIRSKFRQKMDNLEHFQNLNSYSKIIRTKQDYDFEHDADRFILHPRGMEWFADRFASKDSP